MRNWGGGRDVGCVIRFTEADNHRLGNNEPRVSLRDGDLALCVRHSGDYFYDYRLLVRTPQDQYTLGTAFGAYECGMSQKIPGQKFHLLMAGLPTDLDLNALHGIRRTA